MAGVSHGWEVGGSVVQVGDQHAKGTLQLLLDTAKEVLKRKFVTLMPTLERKEGQ